MYLEPQHLWKSNATHSERRYIPGPCAPPMENVPSPPSLIAIHWGDIYNSSAIMSDQGLSASVMTRTLAENWKFHSVAVAVVGWDAARRGDQARPGLGEWAPRGRGSGDQESSAPASGVLLALICPQPGRHQAQPGAARALGGRGMILAPLTYLLSPPSCCEPVEASCITIPVLCSLKGSANS